jgi:excisionase family DNA binding protein
MTAPLLTAREVAGILGVSSETVLRWVRRGELGAIRLPSGAMRFPAPALQDWLAARATPRQGVQTAPKGAALAASQPISFGSQTDPDDDKE